MPKDARDVADVSTDPAAAATGKTAVLYRMALPDHLCPSGQKARWLLEQKGYEVDDRLFRTRAEVDAFKAEHDVPTTPQAWIEGERVGAGTAYRLGSKGYYIQAGDLSFRRGRRDSACAQYRLPRRDHVADARLVHLDLDDPARHAEASRHRGVHHDVPQLRRPGPSMGALCLCLPLGRDRCGRVDDGYAADLARSTGGADYLDHRRVECVQGRLSRPARTQMRLRRRRFERTARFCEPNRESRDDGHVPCHALDTVSVDTSIQGLPLGELEGCQLTLTLLRSQHRSTHSAFAAAAKLWYF